MRSFAYIQVTDVEEALDLLTRYGEDAHVMAGGTALILLLNQGLIEPRVIIGLRGLVDLHRIDLGGDTLNVGALSSLRRVERDPLLCDHAPAVARAVAQVATVRVRNQATIGGNLVHADPAQDPPPILLAHDAHVILRGPSGVRTVPLVDFFVDVFETAIQADEILTTVQIPKPASGSRFEYIKFLPRTVDDYATVSVAVRLDPGPDGTVHDVRIALGNAGAVPFRATAAEAALRGEIPSSFLVEEAATLAADGSDPGEDIRGSATYKREMVRVWTGRALTRALERIGAPA